MWRLLLVDDHALFREGLEGLLAYQDDFKVVGQAEDAQGALALAQEVRPDVVLMDVDLPGDDGRSATRRSKAAGPDATVVMLTAYDDSDRLLQALKAGAQGYLLKNIRSTELLDQLRGLAAGEAPISRRIATRMLEELRRGQDAEGTEPDAKMTVREWCDSLRAPGRVHVRNRSIARRVRPYVEPVQSLPGQNGIQGQTHRWCAEGPPADRRLAACARWSRGRPRDSAGDAAYARRARSRGPGGHDVRAAGAGLGRACRPQTDDGLQGGRARSLCRGSAGQGDAERKHQRPVWRRTLGLHAQRAQVVRR